MLIPDYLVLLSCEIIRTGLQMASHLLKEEDNSTYQMGLLKY